MGAGATRPAAAGWTAGGGDIRSLKSKLSGISDAFIGPIAFGAFAGCKGFGAFVAGLGAEVEAAPKTSGKTSGGMVGGARES